MPLNAEIRTLKNSDETLIIYPQTQAAAVYSVAKATSLEALISDEIIFSHGGLQTVYDRKILNNTTNKINTNELYIYETTGTYYTKLLSSVSNVNANISLPSVTSSLLYKTSGSTFTDKGILYADSTSGAVLNLGTGTSGYVLYSNGTGVAPSWGALPTSVATLTTGRTFTILDSSGAHSGVASTPFNGSANLSIYLPDTITANIIGNLQGYVIAGKKYGTTLGQYSTAEGIDVEASENYTHAEGVDTTASGIAAHSEGNSTIASGHQGSHAEGRGTTASGIASHSEGNGTIASGNYSHAEGTGTTASGIAAHSEGSGTTASGSYSYSGGTNTVSNHRAQYVFGEYNVIDASAAEATARGNYVEIVGNGTSSSRSNARTLDWLGNEEIAGDMIASSLILRKNEGYGSIPPASGVTGQMFFSTEGLPEGSTILSTSDKIYLVGVKSSSDDTLFYNENVYAQNDVLFGAAWNDYAEYRESFEIEPGRVVIEAGNGRLVRSQLRLEPGAEIVSDTYGMIIGKGNPRCSTPIAIAGRVLAYPYENKYMFAAGDAVCSGPNGTVSKMTREEIKEYPERIIGTVSEIPEYEIWGENNIQVNGRIWIRLR